MALAFFLLLQWKKNAVKKTGDPLLVKHLVKNFSSRLFAMKFILILFGFGLCAFAAADLVKPDSNQKISMNGIDVMIALDVSKSMLAEDIKPSRLERAKQIVSKVIDKLSNDKVGIVIFAGKAYLQMPLTTDHSAAKMYLSSASPDDVPTQGTVISDALKMCYAAFDPKEKKYRAIILITDGEDHDDEAIRTTKKLAEEGIMVNTIGIGSPEGAPIMDKETNSYKKDENGNTVISKLNEEELRSIAKSGNGLYQLFTGADEVADNLQKSLSGIGQTNITDTSFTIYKSYFWYFLLAAFVILLLENLLPEKVISNMFRKRSIVIILLFVSNAALSQSAKKEILRGNDAYKNKQYNEAADAYQSALKKSPENSTAFFNLGNALYKTDKPGDALKAYDNTMKNAGNDIKEKVFYNNGVVLQSQKKLPECIEAYKNALKLDPTDEEARQNLERALIQMKQQSQQNKNKDKKQDKQKPDQNKKDQEKQKPDQNKNEDQPTPQPSKISKQDAEEKLKSLLEHEKELQDKLHKTGTPSADKPKKDW